jgi:hypothetical protein
MDYFGLDADERVIAETAAEFTEKRITPYAVEWDATKHFPVDVLRAAAMEVLQAARRRCWPRPHAALPNLLHSAPLLLCIPKDDVCPAPPSASPATGGVPRLDLHPRRT